MAVVPQLNRRGCMILDLSFSVHHLGGRNHQKLGPVLAPSINESTTPLASQLPVHEMGQVLPRLLQFLFEVLPEEPVLFSKIDLANGFW